MATRLCRLSRRFYASISNENTTIHRPKLDLTLRSSDSPLLTDVTNSVVTLRLQRPEAMNALSYDMVRDLNSILKVTRDCEDVSAYFLDAPGKIFCSGVDHKELYKEGVAERGMKPDLSEESMKIRKQYFRDYYTACHLIAKSKIPFVSLVEGACVGGGVSLVTHGSHSMMSRLATMRLPECTFGFFPDGGAGYYLSQIPNNIGFFMAFSNETFNVEECNKWGLTTHTTKFETDDIRKYIISMGSYKSKYSTKVTAYLTGMAAFQGSIRQTIEEIHVDQIELIFEMPTVEEIMLHLRERAKKAFNYNLLHAAYSNMCKMSPTSLKVMHRYMKMAKNMSLEDCLKYEYRIAQNFMRHHDFYEGIRAKQNDRDNNPKWRPKFLEDVTEEIVDKFFLLPEGCYDLDVVREAEKVDYI